MLEVTSYKLQQAPENNDTLKPQVSMTMYPIMYLMGLKPELEI